MTTRLLLLIPTLDRSGAEKQFTLLASRLPRDEFDVHVAALTRGGPYEADLRAANIPVTILDKRWKCDPLAFMRLRRLLMDFQPQILHTWLFAANAYGRLAAGKKPSFKTIVSERCVDSWKSGWQLKLDRRLAPRTSILIGNSNSVADFYRQQGFPAERLAVIPNGVESLAPSSIDRDRVLAEFNIPPGAKVVGFVGRLAKQKRVKDLIWAMQLLRQLTDNVYFLIIGDGPERTRLEELARQLQCDHVTRFAGHRDDSDNLTGLLNVFWLASDFEGMSNSLMEAMAAGVPAVAADIPPNRELLIDGETGYVVRVGDSVGIAQFADRILADDELAVKLGDASRERMRSQFSIDKMVEQHVELYRRIANE
ncbi:MAG: glycosyltransferase [Planctomycetaceae bacterium]|nr:glycosyltransferase [Planctomycetaceae bacterium]MBT6485607.1 glycosyltransferase [Planctomycetaceae bacterium]MBT6493590.1 glycosyltransferase [Planctomycetaceae bacterium]